MSDELKLKPCPLCGCDEIEYAPHNYHPKIYCEDCSLHLYEPGHYDAFVTDEEVKQALISRWNGRFDPKTENKKD